MGSEQFVYFDIAASEVHTAELDELAADIGADDVSHGVTARVSAASTAAAGAEVELSLDVTQVQLFAHDGHALLGAAR
jgi:multiple sugar transport system ATP-binding protein